jgi:hypothetical protein
VKTGPLAPQHQAHIDALLEQLHKDCKQASGNERDRLLFAALTLCGPFRPLPEWLYQALRDGLRARLRQEMDIHTERWLLVKEGRSLAPKGSDKWPWAYKYAAERADGIFAGTPRTMKESYQVVQRRRPKTGPGKT